MEPRNSLNENGNFDSLNLGFSQSEFSAARDEDLSKYLSELTSYNNEFSGRQPSVLDNEDDGFVSGSSEELAGNILPGIGLPDEDYKKMLSEWEKQMGSLQHSDEDELTLSRESQKDKGVFQFESLTGHLESHLKEKQGKNLDMFDASVFTSEHSMTLPFGEVINQMSEDVDLQVNVTGSMCTTEDANLELETPKLNYSPCLRELLLKDNKTGTQRSKINLDSLSPRIPLVSRPSGRKRVAPLSMVTNAPPAKKAPIQWSPTKDQTTQTPASAVSQVVRASLPKEVAERLRRSPAVNFTPTSTNRSTRMQDAATMFGKTKLQLILGSNVFGQINVINNGVVVEHPETVSMDHDYCSSTPSSDASAVRTYSRVPNDSLPVVAQSVEVCSDPTPSRLPEVKTTKCVPEVKTIKCDTATQSKALEKIVTSNEVVQSKSEKIVTSNEVVQSSQEVTIKKEIDSEAQEEVVLKKEVDDCYTRLPSYVTSLSSVPEKQEDSIPKDGCYDRLPSYITELGAMNEDKVKEEPESSNPNSPMVIKQEVHSNPSSPASSITGTRTLKKKLNLKEYRERVKRKKEASLSNTGATTPASESGVSMSGVGSSSPPHVETDGRDSPEISIIAVKEPPKKRELPKRYRLRNNSGKKRRRSSSNDDSSSDTDTSSSPPHSTRSERSWRSSSSKRSYHHNNTRQTSRSRSRSSGSSSSGGSKIKRSSHRRVSRSPTGRQRQYWAARPRAQRRYPPPAPLLRSRNKKSPPGPGIQEIEERRVIYVGNVADGITRDDLRQRFSVFGRVTDVSVHFRDHGENYGFVTFAYRVDAYEAVEHGNDDPTLPRYDLCFGGRRVFCRTQYADLDSSRSQYSRSHEASLDFDDLLRMHITERQQV